MCNEPGRCAPISLLSPLSEAMRSELAGERVYTGRQWKVVVHLEVHIDGHAVHELILQQHQAVHTAVGAAPRGVAQAHAARACAALVAGVGTALCGGESASPSATSSHAGRDVSAKGVHIRMQRLTSAAIRPLVAVLADAHVLVVL